VRILFKSSLRMVLAFLLVFSSVSVLFADDSLKPLLIDIPGWQAESTQAMTMNMNGVNIINTVRSYEKGDSSLDAAVMITSLQMGLASFQQMNMSDGSVELKSSKIDGFKVMHTHDKDDNSGSIMILLGESEQNSALFSIAYEDVSKKDSLAIAKKFDWAKIQKAAKKLMK